jgi:hypothetical protein
MDDFSDDGETQERLEDLAPAGAAYLNRSTTIAKVLVKVGNSKKKPFLQSIQLPESLEQEPVSLSIIWSLNRTTNTPVRNYVTVGRVEKFLELAEKSLVKGKLPITIFNDYRLHLIDTSISDSSVKNYISCIASLVSGAFDSNEFAEQLSSSQRRHLRKIMVNVPTVRGKAQKRKCLSELSGQADYDDLQLIQGLRTYAPFLMGVMQKQRCELLKDDAVRASLELAIESRGILSFNMNEYKKGKGTSVLMRPIVDHVLKSKNLPIKERFLLGYKPFRDTIDKRSEVLSEEELNKWLAEASTNVSKTKTNRIGISNHLSLNHFDFEMLIKPTRSEELLLSMYLASERVQTSGQQKMQLGNIIVYGSGDTIINYEKGRSRSNPDKHTDIKGPNHPATVCIKEHIRLLENHDAYDNLVDPSILLRNPSYSDPAWRYLCYTLHNSSPTLLLLLKTHPDAEQLVQLLRDLTKNGNERVKRATELEYARRAEKESGVTDGELVQAVRRKYQHSKKITFSPSAIAESVAVIDNPVQMANSAAQEIEDAALEMRTAHNLKTHVEVYLNRSNSKYRIRNVRTPFAIAVGQIMEIKSQEVSALMESTDVLTPENVGRAIGLKEFETDEHAELSNILEAAAARGKRVSYFGEISDNTKKIVIATPVVAAMLISALRNYESAYNDEPNNTDLQRRLAIESALVMLKLDEFPKSILKKGEELLDVDGVEFPIIELHGIA